MENIFIILIFAAVILLIIIVLGIWFSPSEPTRREITVFLKDGSIVTGNWLNTTNSKIHVGNYNVVKNGHELYRGEKIVLYLTNVSGYEIDKW